METLASFPKVFLLVLMVCGLAVVMGSPFLALAFIWWRLTRSRVPASIRVVVASFVSAVGLAPFVYAHGVVPIYVLLLSGEPLSRSLLTTFGVTFGLVLVLFAVIASVSARGGNLTMGSTGPR